MGSLPPEVGEAIQNAQNVTGAEVVPPTDLDGYLDEPQFRFGLWVGETEDEADLETFELNGDQIQRVADAFQRAADDAAALGDGDD